MSPPRIYLPGTIAAGCEVELDARAAGHIRVLRLRSGDKLILFNGDGMEYAAELIASNKESTICRIIDVEAHDSESPLSIELAQGISRGERMDYTLQKAVELGVTRIIPLDTERSQVKLSGEREEKRIHHWRGVILHACEQSGRTSIPVLEPVSRLNDWLSTRVPNQLNLLLDPQGDRTVSTLDGPFDTTTLLVGPEGGLSPTEREYAAGLGFKRLRLGPRVLRTETAAIVAIAALQSRWGDLS